MSNSHLATETIASKQHVLSMSSAESSPATSFSGLYNARAVPSETSSDDSEESYREKFEGLQALVRQLNRQLQSEKIRKEGVNTISQSLKEERRVNTLLQEENQTYKHAVRVLQNRLANAKLQTNVDPEEEETTSSILGFEAIDSLVRENLGLKDELKYLSIDPSKMDEILKHNNELKERSINLAEQLRQATDENRELKKLLASSPDEKLRENSKLRGQLEELRHRGKTRDVLCQSLSDESQALQERLRETGNMCQRLLQRLEQHEGPSGGSMETGGATGNFDLQSPLSSTFVKLSLNNPDVGQLRQEYTALEDKMAGLRTQLKEVIQVNEKWQEYHEKREREFQEMKGRLQASEQRLAQAPPSSLLSEQQQEQIDRLVLQYKRKIEVIENEKEMLGDENRQLRVQVSQQLETNQKLEQQITLLLEQRRARQQQDGRYNEDRERFHALEMQVKLFSEDFASEKQDRERAQAKVTNLEREISAYKSQLEALQRSALSRIGQRRYGHAPGHGLIQCDDDEDLDMDDVEMPVPTGPPMQLIGRGPNESENEGEDQVDLPTRKQPNNDIDQTIPMVTKPTPNILQCPQCQKEFPTDLHCELLEHMEKCLQ